MRRQRTPAPPPKESPLTAWLDGTRVRILTGVHEGREAVVQRLYKANGAPDGFLPECLRVVFVEPVCNSTESYCRPKVLQLLELGTTPPPPVHEPAQPTPARQRRAPLRPADKGPRQRGLFG